MKTFFLNPTLAEQDQYIREGRCMQKAASWATAWPPITLATLAAIAQSKSEVKLIDGNVEPTTLQELLHRIEIFDPDLIVVNTGFPSIDNDMAVAQKIKQTFPDIKLLAFGVYFTLLEKEALDLHPYLDFGIAGEPEETFEALLNFLSEDKWDYHLIQGLMYRDFTGVHVNLPRPFIQDLDQLPFPDRGLLKNERYRLPHNNHTYTLINIARGCPYPCTYCIVNPYYGRKVRKHSVDYVIREMKECMDRYGVQEFLFWDEVFTLDRDFALAICEAMMKNNLSTRWAATTRVGLLDEVLLGAMKKAGCYLLGLGVESASQEILNNVKKKQTVEEIKRAVALCKKAGIQTMGHFIFGLPGETEETAENTIRFMKRLGLDYMQSYCAVPYPKTEFGELAKEKGWIGVNRWSQYDFGGTSIVNIGTISPERVTHFREKAFRSFYFRPFYLLRKIFGQLSISQWFRLLNFKDWMNSRKERQVHGNGSKCCDPLSERGENDSDLRSEGARCASSPKSSR